MASRVPDDVQTFVRTAFTSMEDVDAILLLMRQPTRACTAEEVASALVLNAEVTGARLFLMAARGLLACDAAEPARYRYVVSDDEEDRLLRIVAEICAADRPAIAAVVEQLPVTLVQRFADVFKWPR